MCAHTRRWLSPCISSHLSVAVERCTKDSLNEFIQYVRTHGGLHPPLCVVCVAGVLMQQYC